MTNEQMRLKLKAAALNSQIALLQKELEQIQDECEHRKEEIDSETCSICGLVLLQDCN